MYKKNNFEIQEASSYQNTDDLLGLSSTFLFKFISVSSMLAGFVALVSCVISGSMAVSSGLAMHSLGYGIGSILGVGLIGSGFFALNRILDEEQSCHFDYNFCR